MEHRRISLFAGHYGSGKTNIAVNYALALRKTGAPVTIVDLDIVNPYFRTKDSKAELDAAGIKLISSRYANSNVDVPALPADIYGIVERRDVLGVMDVGGDDRGALVLGRFTPYILEENDYELFMVVNCYRPLTRTAADAVEVIREIEQAGGIKATALVNNSNLGSATTEKDIFASLDYVNQISEQLQIPVRLTAVHETLYQGLLGIIENLFPLHLQAKYYE